MTVTIEPTTDTELDESLDFEIVCEYATPPEGHDGCDRVAEWAVWTSETPCGCMPAMFRYFCDVCWWYRNRGDVVCPKCSHEWPSQENIINAERFRVVN